MSTSWFWTLHEYKFWKYFTLGLRLHGPIWLSFCAQVAMTYTIGVMICILHSGHMVLFCICELTAHGGLWILSYFCHFAFRPHRPPQVTWTYMITILCSGCTDLYNQHFALRLHGPIIYILHLNITMLPSAMLLSAIPTNHSSPQCTHVTSYKLWHYKYKCKIMIK